MCEKVVFFLKVFVLFFLALPRHCKTNSFECSCGTKCWQNTFACCWPVVFFSRVSELCCMKQESRFQVRPLAPDLQYRFCSQVWKGYWNMTINKTVLFLKGSFSWYLSSLLCNLTYFYHCCGFLSGICFGESSFGLDLNLAMSCLNSLLLLPLLHVLK